MGLGYALRCHHETPTHEGSEAITTFAERGGVSVGKRRTRFDVFPWPRQLPDLVSEGSHLGNRRPALIGRAK